MKQGFRTLYSHSTRFYAVVVFLIAQLLALGVIVDFERKEFAIERERAYSLLSIQTERVEKILDNLLYSANVLEVLLRQDDRIDNFDTVVEGLIGDRPIRNISIAPDGIVSQVYPLKGNEAAVGHNLLLDPNRETEALIAKNNRSLTLSGPYTLRQGGIGLVGRLPVFLDGTDGQPYFWGFINVALAFPECLNDADLDSLERNGYSFQLWRTHPDTREKQILLQSSTGLASMTVDGRIQIPNSNWTLSLSPAIGWLRKDYLAARCLVGLVFSLLCSFLCKSVLELAKNRDELDMTLNQQMHNYRKLNQLNEELKDFRHDVKNHMLSLTNLLEHNDIGEARDYLSSLSFTVAATNRLVNTENYIFDALISEKLEEAYGKNIRVETEISLPGKLMIRNMDWSILFGNALDNAIEACMQLTDVSPRICLSVQYTGNILHVKISNTAPAPRSREDAFFRTSKKDGLRHGRGLSNISAAVKRYGGVMETQFQDGIFTLSFLLFEV